MPVQFNPQVKTAPEAYSPASTQNQLPVNQEQFKSVLAGSEKKAEQGFFSKALSTTWTIVTWPFVKTYQLVKWLVCCCPKGEASSTFEPKADVLKALLAENPKASGKVQAKDPSKLYADLLENCLADPKKMKEAWEKEQTKLGEFTASFQTEIDYDNPFFARGEIVKLSTDFYIANPKALTDGMYEASIAIVKALDSASSDDANLLKSLFGTFLPALAKRIESDPESHRQAIDALLNVDARDYRNFAAVLRHVPDLDNVSGFEQVKMLYATLSDPANPLANLELDLQNGTALLGVSGLSKVLPFCSLREFFLCSTTAALTPGHIDQLTKNVDNIRADHKLLWNALKEHPNTPHRAEAVAVFYAYKNLLGL